MADLTDQQVRDEWAKYYGSNQGTPVNVSRNSFTDYIPNIFGTENSAFSGLLGADQTKALSKQSNISGLLGAVAALGQGMSSQGPRRSALQNILSAVGAGYGAAGQGYQQGLQNYSQAQQLQANIDKQKAFADMAIKYPDLAPLARIDPAKFVEMVSQLEQQRPIAEAYKNASGQQPVQQYQPNAEQLAYQQDLTKYNQDLSGYNNQVNQMLGTPISGSPVSVVAGTAPVREPTTPLAAGTVEMNPVPEMLTGKYDASMPKAPVAPTAPIVQPAPQVNPADELIKQKNTLLRVNSNLSRLGTKAANDEVKNNLEQIKSLDTQIQQYAVGGFDFEGFKKSVPAELHADIDSLKQLSKSGSINGDQLRQGLQLISKESLNINQKLSDYTNEVIRTAAEFYPKTKLTDLTPDQLKRLNAVLLQRDKEARRSGAPVTNIDMGQRTVAIERAKAQVASETAAEGALAVAGDVRAIVDALKPYKGGKLDEFKASLGSYFPDTSLARMSSAADFANALRAKIAPTLRVPGSGATSDFETKQFMAAIPSLSQYPEGRELLATYTQRFADRAAAAADIKAKMIEDGTYSLKAFQKQLSDAGYARVLSPEDLQILNVTQSTTDTSNLSPAGQSAYDKYKPR
jgi:hypothetical protein